MHLQVVQVVTFTIAFALAATRILGASKPLWGFLPPVVAGPLPGLIVALPALAQGLTGAQSWTDLTVAFLVAAALVAPGIHSHTVAIKPPNGPNSAGLGFALAFVFALTLGACASLKPFVKSVDQAAIILCDVFFAQQPQAKGISPEDVEKAFCSTAEQVAPFLDSANRAMGRAGAVRLGHSKQ